MRNLPFVGEFRLSMTEALRTQLLATLDALEWTPLTSENLDLLNERGGVYQLALDQHPVYVGKSAKALARRLGKHHHKLRGRFDASEPESKNPLIERTSFRCVYVDEDLDSVAPEKMLMRELGARGESEWNNAGFGNNDPGRQRDTSLVKEQHFDRRYPINLEVPLTLKLPQSPDLQASTLMKIVKSDLPFLFRHSAPPAECAADWVPLPSNGAPARDWFEAIASILPAGWKTVALPGYVISYPDVVVSKYASRTGAWVSTGGGAEWVQHHPQFDRSAIDSEPVTDDQ